MNPNPQSKLSLYWYCWTACGRSVPLPEGILWLGEQGHPLTIFKFPVRVKWMNPGCLPRSAATTGLWDRTCPACRNSLPWLFSQNFPRTVQPSMIWHSIGSGKGSMKQVPALPEIELAGFGSRTGRLFWDPGLAGYIKTKEISFHGIVSLCAGGVVLILICFNFTFGFLLKISISTMRSYKGKLLR